MDFLLVDFGKFSGFNSRLGEASFQATKPDCRWNTFLATLKGRCGSRFRQNLVVIRTRFGTLFIARNQIGQTESSKAQFSQPRQGTTRISHRKGIVAKSQRPDDFCAGWVGKVASGDQEVFGALYDATSRLVYGLALRMVGGSAEDVTLDVYLQV